MFFTYQRLGRVSLCVASVLWLTIPEVSAEVKVFAHSHPLLSGPSTFYQYSSSSNSWTGLGSLGTNIRRSQFATDIMGNVFTYNDSTRRINRYVGGTTWQDIGLPSPGITGAGYNLEVTNSGQFLLSRYGSGTAYSLKQGQNWQPFSIGATANFTGDYDPVTGRYVVGVLGQKRFVDINTDTFSRTFSSYAGSSGEYRRMGSIVGGYLVENTSTNGIRRWDMNNFTGSSTTLSQTGGDWLASGVDRVNQTLYTYDFNGGQFGTKDVVGGQFTPLASGPNLVLSSIAVVNTDVTLDGIVTQSRYDHSVDSLTIGGNRGAGRLDVMNSSELTSGYIIVNSNGTLSIEGGSTVTLNSGSTTTVSGALQVSGNIQGAGAQIVANTGSTVEYSGAVINGASLGGNGTHSVIAHSTFNNVAVNGNLTIDAGKTLSGTSGVVASTAGSTGTVTVNGSGTAATYSDSLNVGSQGSGALNIEAGGVVSNTYAEVGVNSGSMGTVTVTGAGSQWNNSSDLTVGYEGSGTMNVQAGGVVSNAYAEVGVNSGSMGTVTVTGTGSQWNNSSGLTVGLEGSGTMNVQAGGVVSNPYAEVGVDPGSIGTVTVAGAGSQWNNSSNLEVGYEGSGTLNIEAGGVVSNTYAYVGDYSGSMGTVTVTGAGSQWNNSDSLDVGSAGSGTVNVEAGGVISSTGAALGSLSGSTGTVTVTGAGSQWNNSSDLYVGGNGSGTMNIEAGGVVSNTYAEVGENSGSTGTVTVTGTGSQWNNSSDLYVGGDGSGTLNIEAGAVVTNSSAYVAEDSGSTGTVTVTGTASQWNSSGSLYVGGDERRAGGTGTVNVTNGGSLSVADTLNIYAGSAVNVDAASSLSAGQIIANGQLNWTNGSLNIGAGQMLAGSGDLSGVTMVSVAGGGLIAPGNSTDMLTVGNIEWGTGGIFDFEINDFNGTAGSDTLGWDLLSASSIDITATSLDPFKINLMSLTDAQISGMAQDFDDLMNYPLMFATTTGGISGFNPGLFTIDTSGFQNVFTGSWTISQAGNDLFLNYSAAAVPEPSSLILLSLGVIGYGIYRRRRKTERLR